MHQRSNVLDVVRAVTEVAPDHPGVLVWWYVPRLLEDPKIELLVEVGPDNHEDLMAIARAVEARLPAATVTVAPHGGSNETRRLFRVLSSSRGQQQPA